MGHRDIRTTEIYTALVGREERAVAQRTWDAHSREFRAKRAP